MRDPVVTADGQTYEREAIQDWLQQQQSRGLPPTSPITGEPLEHTSLVPNVALRGLIREAIARDQTNKPHNTSASRAHLEESMRRGQCHRFA